jgi:cysteine synthase B
VERIGDTPLLPLPSPSPEVRILGKAEWMNPGGSVKDRAALGIVEAARREGILPERGLLDASSGNTGIAYAMLGAALGFEVVICLPENASPERKGILSAYGAELILTDPLEGMDRARELARELAEERSDRLWYADQYSNPENWRAHYRTTGPELLRQTDGRITHLVAGLGTTGTLVGTGRRLREEVPEVELVAVEPEGVFHGLEGLKHLPSSRVPAIYDVSLVDRRVRVSTEEGWRGAARLARGSGLFVGPSAGAAYAAARRLAGELDRGTLAVVLPDGGGRYLADAPWSDRDGSSSGVDG